jgi:hypothetical protein
MTVVYYYRPYNAPRSSIEILGVGRVPVSAHQRNLRHLAVISTCQILFSEILSVLHNFKRFGVVPVSIFWPEASTYANCAYVKGVRRSQGRSRRGRHLTQVPQARGPHRTLSDAFPVSVQERSGLFHVVLRRGLPVSAGLLESPHIKGQGVLYSDVVRSRHQAP